MWNANAQHEDDPGIELVFIRRQFVAKKVLVLADAECSWSSQAFCGTHALAQKISLGA
jgi:hypothetical protein